MTAKVERLRPKRHDTIAQSLQLALELPLGLSDTTRDELAEALGRYEPAPTWTYTMLSPEQLRTVLKLINASEKPAITLRVWTALVSHVRLDSGEIMAGRARLAEDAETTPQEVSRALGRLADMGALTRLRPGRYAINPHVGWAGSLAKRETAAKDVPPLRIMEGGRQ
jgi:DNA-binding transcriptional ArsR family regulator